MNLPEPLPIPIESVPTAVDADVQGSSRARPAPAAVEGIGLTDLLREVQAAIQHVFPRDRRVWVRAEVVQVQARAHLRLELAEHSEEGTLAAKASAVIFANAVRRIQAKFADLAGGELRAGIRVLLQVSVDYKPDFGLSLFVHDIDPSYTIGDMEARLARIREKLIQEGVFERNRRMPQPAEFCRVAVVSPEQAAGLGDFQSCARVLEQCGLCEFVYHHAPFQGEGVADGIVDTLRRVYQSHRERPFDALVIIRGGGAKSDLYYLNELKIANAICRMNMPVLVGIGHERDSTILDEVANQSFGTPSLVIAHIRDRIVDNARRAERAWQSIVSQSRRQLDLTRSQLDRERDRIRSLAREHLLGARLRTDEHYREVGRLSRDWLERARQDIRLWYAEIVHAGPRQALKRGYAVVRDQDGRAVSRREAAQKAERLEIEFVDGRVRVVPEPGNGETS